MCSPPPPHPPPPPGGFTFMPSPRALASSGALPTSCALWQNGRSVQLRDVEQYGHSCGLPACYAVTYTVGGGGNERFINPLTRGQIVMLCPHAVTMAVLAGSLVLRTPSLRERLTTLQAVVKLFFLLLQCRLSSNFPSTLCPSLNRRFYLVSALSPYYFSLTSSCACLTCSSTALSN